MFLKSIELHGFKSFTDKTKLQFGTGVSAIVGPNGSGKSNVADAVRWVLGEQSAKSLRGNKMEDVIFAGTKNRKPLGMAEVSIILDNSDGCLPLEFNEITVTRRTYRSGEGEYLINNTPCRLKDIHRLFMDTGIGIDGFSIIGQGKVEEILNCRPEERRSLIEETAGIVKYRNRKKEASRKLNDTEQSLERIRDIIYELSGQVGPLEEQAKKTKSYRKLKAEADELEISLAVQNMEEVKVKLDETISRLDEKQLELISLQSLEAQLEAQVEELKLKISRWDEEITADQQVLYGRSADIERRESDIRLVSARKDALFEQIFRLDSEVKELAEKVSSLDTALCKESKKQQELSKETEAQQIIITSREGAQKEKSEKITSLEEEIEILKSKAFDLVQEMANLRNEVNSREQHIQTIDYAVEKLETQKEEFSRFISMQEQKKAEITQSLDRCQKEKTELKDRQEKLEKETDILGKNVREWEEIENSRREKLRSVSSRLGALTEMQEGYEGYYPGVKAVLTGKRRSNPQCLDIIGVMAELITVSSKYRLAVETALGGALQNVVTKTDQGAKSAIAYLKKTGSGRATFLPLNVLHQTSAKDITPLIKGVDGVIGLAADLVTSTEQVRPAVDFLLRRVVVVNDMEAALKAARASKYQVRIVTLEGDVVNPGGAMTGGSRQKNNGNLLARIEEIKRLTHEKSEMETVCRDTEVELASARGKLEQVRIKKEQCLNDLREAEISAGNYERELVQCGEALQAAGGNLDAVIGEIESNLLEKKVLASEKDSIIEEQKEAEIRNDELVTKIAGLQADLKGAKESLNRRQDDLTDIKVQLAGLLQEEAAAIKNLSRLKEERTLALSALENKNAEKALLESEVSAKEQEIVCIEDELLRLKKEQGEMEDSLQRKRHARTAEYQSMEQKEKEARETVRKLTLHQQEVHQLEMKQSRLEMEWEKNLEKLRDKFRLEFTQASLLKKEISSKRAASQRISEIELEMDALGPVNINAVEEFERVNERYRFLLGQENDLSEARESLFKVIDEMDRIMVKRFRETFNRVCEEFNTTFAHLFGGGVAQLRLTDPENILETGIEIIVQPPGKKVQHHNLLSGGEKSLTGIALLFAILTVRPSPFCILDEIEAALDEANVDRYAAYMKQYAEKTQFIVVTHRQGTMEVADVLYGITMEENGISKTVSVKLAG